MTDPEPNEPPGQERPPAASKRGLRRVWNAFWFSVAGLRAALSGEAAFRQEAALCVVLAPLAAFVDGTLTQKSLLLLALLVVLITELLNSAVEATVDRHSRAIHPLAKRAKDLGSAAVLLSLVACGLVWVLVLTDIYA